MASAPPPPPPKRLVGTTTPTPSRDAPPPPPPPRQRPVGVVAETLNPQGIAVTRTIPVATSSTTGAANHHNQHHHPQQASGGVVPLQRHTSSSSNAALGTNGVGGPPPPIRKSLVQQPIVQQQMGSSPGGAGMIPPPRTSGAAMNGMPSSNGAPPPPPPPPPQRGVAISSATGAAIPPPPPQRIQSANLPPPPPQQRMSAGGTHPGATPQNAHGAAPPPPPRSPQQQQPPGLSPTLVLATIASLEKESRRNILKAEQETLELLWELHHSAQAAVLALSSSTGHLRASNEQSAKLRRIERREQRLGRPQLLFRPKTSVSVAKQQQQHRSSSSSGIGTSSSATSNHHAGSSSHGLPQKTHDPALLCLKVADVRFLCNKIRNEVELHLVETVQSGTAAAGGETAATTADDDAVDGGEESDEVVCLRKVRPRLHELTQSLHHLINCVTVPHSSSSESNVLVPPVSYAPCESSSSVPGNEVGGVPTAGGGSGGGQLSKLALPTSTHTAAAMSGQCLVSDEQFAFFVDAFWNWSEALDEKKDVTGPGEADDQPSSPRATTNAAAPTHPSAFQQLCALPSLSGRYFAAVPQCTEWFQAQELTCAFYLAVLQRYYLGTFSQLTPITTPNVAAGFGGASACASSSKKEKKLVLPPLGLLHAAMESSKTMSLPLHVDVVQLVLAMTTQYHQQPAHLLPLNKQGGKVGDSKRGILDGGALSSQHPLTSSKNNNNNSKAGGGGGGASRKKRYQEARGGGREATHEQGALPEKIPDRNDATSALAVVWEPLFLSRRYLALVPTILASSSSSPLSTGGRYCMLVADKAGFSLSLDGPNVDRHASNSHASSPASAVSKKQITPLLGFTGADANVMARDGPVSVLCHQDQPGGGGCGGSSSCSSLLRTVNHFFELQLSGLRSSVWHHSVFYEANQIQAMLIFATDFALACLEQLTGSALGGEQQEAADPKMALADASAAALALLHHLLMTYYQLAAQEQNKRQQQGSETGGGSSIEDHLPLKGMMSWGRLLTALTPVHTWGTDHEQDINPGGVRGTDPTLRVTERLQNHWHVALGDLLQYFQVWM